MSGRTHVGMRTFVEAEHPRGQVANRGQFREKTDAVPTGELTDTGEDFPICPRHGGTWGDDITCEMCVDEEGELRPVPHTPAEDTPVADTPAELTWEERAAQRYADIDRWGQTGVNVGSRTPWGTADNVSEVAPGITIADTPSHGGVKLTPQRNKEIPPALRNSSGWYEEDCEVNIPMRYFPAEFAAQPHLRDRWTAERMAESAEQSIKDWFPVKWERANGRKLEAGESRENDRLLWAEAHKSDFVVTSARTADSDPDLVRVTAKRAIDEATAEYLIPKAEYEARRDGDRGRDGRFAVDPSRHRRLPAEPAKPPAPEPPLHRVSIPDLQQRMSAANLTTSAKNRVVGDLNKRWQLNDGRVMSLKGILEHDGVEGRTCWPEGTRIKYRVVLRSGSVSVSKATWDFLADELPDTRSEQTIARDAYAVASEKLQIETDGRSYRLQRDEKARARVEKLEAEVTRLRAEMNAAWERADAERARKAAAEPTAEERKAAMVARERAAVVSA